ncbi:hypothetical protein ACINLE_18035 [Bacillus sp. z60-18]|uniref:response regulator aspartate phosphatase n=1 Tax=Bacillus TaxID=1386 RepID=UPI002118F3BF|nr:hypothetical protein [Bacillus sonorensis]
MSVKIPSQKVGNMLNQWYGIIKLQQVHKAKLMRDQIEHALKNMEEDQDVLLSLI